MENKFLTQFLQMREGLANAEVKKNTPVSARPTPDISFSSLQTIIEEKPDKKKVIEYFQRRRDELNEEYGN